MLTLLTAAAQYKRKEPADLEEAELVENLFDALGGALELPANQLAFLKAEGIELMVLTLKERRYAARGALKVLDTSNDGEVDVDECAARRLTCHSIDATPARRRGGAVL